MSETLTQERTEAPFYGHSNDLRWDFVGGEKLHAVESQLGIRSLLESLKAAGWDKYQWRSGKPGKMSFIELGSTVYRDFRRVESQDGILPAVQALVNRVQAIIRCENETRHSFAARPGYDNGLLSCEHCGFGGYESIFERKSAETAHLEAHVGVLRDEIMLLRTRLGVAITLGGEVAVANARIHPQDDKRDGYTVIGDTDKVSFLIEKDLKGGHHGPGT